MVLSDVETWSADLSVVSWVSREKELMRREYKQILPAPFELAGGTQQLSGSGQKCRFGTQQANKMTPEANANNVWSVQLLPVEFSQQDVSMHGDRQNLLCQQECCNRILGEYALLGKLYLFREKFVVNSSLTAMCHIPGWQQIKDTWSEKMF